MKRLTTMLIGLLTLCSMAFAGNPQVYTFPDNGDSISCETNAAAAITNTSSIFLDGWVESVIVDLSGAANTGTVTVATTGVNSGVGASRTILSTAALVADTQYNPRLVVGTTAGVDIATNTCKFPLVQDKVRVTLYGFTSTNTTAKVYLIIGNTPSP